MGIENSNSPHAKHRTALVLAFVCGVVAVGFPYWSIPYEKLALPNDILGWGLVVIVVLAAMARGVFGVAFWPTLIVVGACAPAAVLIRVLFDVVRDPTSHNLWPFELALAAGPGFIAALVGALAGGFFARDRDA